MSDDHRSESVDWSAARKTSSVDAAFDSARDAIAAADGRPVILKGLAASWPAARAGTTSGGAFLNYLDALAPSAASDVEVFVGPPSRRGRLAYTDDLGAVNFEKRRETLAGLVRRLRAHESDAAAPIIYAGAIRVRDTLPAFLVNNPNPLPKPADQQLISLWIGNRTIVPSHWDFPENLLCVVAGRRRYTLTPPEQIAALYPGPLDHTLAGQPSSLVDFAAPDLTRFPRFPEAVAASQVAELAPGDALYIPSMWWHRAESLDPIGAMMNFWWRDGPADLASPLPALLHALMRLRVLPLRERAAWCAHFDYYVFGDRALPTAHLPPKCAGFLEPDTPEDLHRLAEIIVRSLPR